MTWLLLGVGCQDVALSTVTHAPEADITSHVSGAAVQEGYEVTLRGYVRDKDDDAEQLVAGWYLGGAELCAAAAPAADGSTSCVLVPEAGELVVTLEVVDSDDQVTVATLDLVGVATDPPSAVITSPDDGNLFAFEQSVTFTGHVFDAEDRPDELDVWWESSLDGVLDVDAQPDSDGEISGTGTLSAGEHQIELHVEDRAGKSDVDVVSVSVEDCDLYAFYADGDGDGFGDELVEACAKPNGTVTVDGDCDDGDDGIHPDAEDICEDGVDQDCSGTDLPCECPDLDTFDDGTIDTSIWSISATTGTEANSPYFSEDGGVLSAGTGFSYGPKEFGDFVLSASTELVGLDSLLFQGTVFLRWNDTCAGWGWQEALLSDSDGDEVVLFHAAATEGDNEWPVELHLISGAHSGTVSLTSDFETSTTSVDLSTLDEPWFLSFRGEIYQEGSCTNSIYNIVYLETLQACLAE